MAVFDVDNCDKIMILLTFYLLKEHCFVLNTIKIVILLKKNVV